MVETKLFAKASGQHLAKHVAGRSALRLARAAFAFAFASRQAGVEINWSVRGLDSAG